jgi:hypothetical protein
MQPKNWSLDRDKLMLLTGAKYLRRENMKRDEYATSPSRIQFMY